MREVAFLDRPTKTLILVDLVDDIGDATPGANLVLRVWWALLGMWNRPAPAPEYRFGWRDRETARACLARLLAWEFERVVPAHGRADPARRPRPLRSGVASRLRTVSPHEAEPIGPGALLVALRTRPREWQNAPMGMVHADLDVVGTRGHRETVRFLVDSGAFYSVLPESLWHSIGLEPTRDLEFVLADGTSIARKISECRFVYQGIEATSPVVLGEGEDVALLGAVTLETLGLMLNPLRRTLTPVRMRLATHAAI